MYATLYPDDEPPCETCRPERLTAENEIIFEVFSRLFLGQNQLDVFKVMDLLGIKNKLKCLDTIAMLINELGKK